MVSAYESVAMWTHAFLTATKANPAVLYSCVILCISIEDHLRLVTPTLLNKKKQFRSFLLGKFLDWGDISTRSDIFHGIPTASFEDKSSLPVLSNLLLLNTDDQTKILAIRSCIHVVFCGLSSAKNWWSYLSPQSSSFQCCLCGAKEPLAALFFESSQC